MKALDLVRKSFDMSFQLLAWGIGDLSDTELAHRPVERANSTVWQIGHLTVSLHDMIEALRPGKMPPLPTGFRESFTKNGATSAQATAWGKVTLLEAYRTQMEGAKALLDSFTEGELEQPAPEKMRSWAPTIGDLLLGASTHPLLHTGQISVVRRALGKSILY